MPVNKGQFYLSRDKYPDECAKQIAEMVKAGRQNRVDFQDQIKRQMSEWDRDWETDLY